MKFEWDERKNLTNYAKHKVSFELASKVFDDPLAALKLDSIVNAEERWLILGRALDICILVVVHTYRMRDDQEVIRIISARRATIHERRLYEEEK